MQTFLIRNIAMLRNCQSIQFFLDADMKIVVTNQAYKFEDSRYQNIARLLMPCVLVIDKLHGLTRIHHKIIEDVLADQVAIIPSLEYAHQGIHNEFWIMVQISNIQLH